MPQGLQSKNLVIINFFSHTAKFVEKHEAAIQREADRAAKRAEKANAKGESRNSSGNLTSDPRSYDERYAAGDF